MTDPLQLAAALDFLASSPAPGMTPGPATPEHRRFMIQYTQSRDGLLAVRKRH
jgi:hypothetical protein